MLVPLRVPHARAPHAAGGLLPPPARGCHKPAIAVDASVFGLAQFRSLVDSLSEYRDFLERKINERMNACNEEKLSVHGDAAAPRARGRGGRGALSSHGQPEAPIA